MPIITHRYSAGTMHIDTETGVVSTPRGTYASPRYMDLRMHTGKKVLSLRLFRTYNFGKIYRALHVRENEQLTLQISGIPGTISFYRVSTLPTALVGTEPSS